MTIPEMIAGLLIPVASSVFRNHAFTSSGVFLKLWFILITGLISLRVRFLGAVDGHNINISFIIVNTILNIVFIFSGRIALTNKRNVYIIFL